MSRRLGRSLIMAFAALAVILAAFVGGRASSSATGTIPVAARAVVVPAAGAQAFAVEAVRNLNSPRMVDFAYRNATLTRFLDPTANNLADRFVPGPGFEAATGLAVDQAAGRATVAQVVPVAASSTTEGPNKARVLVWAVTVVGTRRLGQLVASWSTESLALRREDGGWRIVDYRSSPGPVPAATQPPTDVRSALGAISAMRNVADGR
jgi:hypothetical protein